MAKIKVYQTKGRGFGTVIEANREALAFWKPAARNKLIRESLKRGGNNFRALFFKKRPTEMIRKAPWNYKLKPKRRGQNARTPLIGRHTGSDKLIRAMYTGRITGSKTRKNGFVLRIGIPLGHPVSKEVSDVMSIVSQQEVEWLVDNIGQGIAKGIEKGRIQEKLRVEKAKDRRNQRARARYVAKQRALGRSVKQKARRR